VTRWRRRSRIQSHVRTGRTDRPSRQGVIGIGFHHDGVSFPGWPRRRKSGSAVSARAHVTHQFAAFCKVMATKYRILNALR